MKATNTKVYSLDIKNGFIVSTYIGKLNGRNIIPNVPNIVTNESSDKSKVKILIQSEAKIEATVAKGTTVRHPEYMDKIVPYETEGAKIPFEINCICFYERAVVDYLRIEKSIEADEKKKLFSRQTIGEDEFQIKPAWAENEVVICREDDVSLKFDGKKLSLLKNGNEVKFWKAMSGRKGFNAPEYQDKKNQGPLPKGEYDLKKLRAQNYDDTSTWDRIKGTFGGGTWPGGQDSWGDHRIWLDPKEGTDTLGRSNFSVHGGKEFGSAGCIDLAGGMNDFMQDYTKITNEIQRDLVVSVEY